MKQMILSAMIGLLSINFAIAANQPTIVKPDTLKWQPANDLPGAEVAMMSGDPDKKEPFIARVRLPANFHIPVHSHHINEYDTVISGAFYLGIGNKVDANHMQKLSAGSFVMIPAKLPHYAWTKQVTILQVNGMGPWGMVYKKPDDNKK